MSECTGPCAHPDCQRPSDPWWKTNGEGNWMRLSESGMNRADRRQYLRERRRAS